MSEIVRDITQHAKFIRSPHNIDNTNVQSDDYGNGGGQGGGGDMLKRIERLEEKVASISSDLAVIKATMCTKEDLHKELNGQTWKIITALVITVLIAVFSRYFLK